MSPRDALDALDPRVDTVIARALRFRVSWLR